MPDVFLSYSREDQVTVRHYAEALEHEGFNVWWDTALHPGETFDQVTEQALKDSSAVVVFWSKHSVTSRWVRSEATQADRYGKLVPVTIEACDRPIMFELTHTMDLSGWKGDRNDAAWRNLVASLKRLVERGGASIAAASVAAPAPAPKTRRSSLALVALAALIAIGAGLYGHFHGRYAKDPAANSGATGATKPATLASIAVLPFKDMSQNKDQEYFADGVTEEILNSLAGLKDLRVTARTSAFAFKGKDVDLRTVGETLDVQHVLEGSIRKDGETLRITAQLIDTKSDAHVWSKTYDRPLKDIFKIQDEIARSVAEALQVSLGVGVGQQTGMTRDVEAYDAYLEAQSLRARFNLLGAIELLERAVARDGNFLLARSTLANAYAELAAPGVEDQQDWRRKADEAFKDIQRQFPDSPVTHLALAQRALNGARWSEAGAHYRDAARTSVGTGNNDDGDQARFLLIVGRSREAIAMLEKQRARDPLNAITSLYLMQAYPEQGNYAAALTETERVYPNAGALQLLLRRVALTNALGANDRKQIERWLDAIESEGGAFGEMGTRRKSELDKPVESLANLRASVRSGSVTGLAASEFAIWLAYRADPETALAALRLGFKGPLGPVPVASNLWQPIFRDVRKLPAFKQLVRDIGLVDYWTNYGWGDFCKPGTDDFECN